MRTLTVILIVSFLVSCADRQREKARAQFASRDPDAAVLNNLRVYDSLRVLVTSQMKMFFDEALLQDTTIARHSPRNSFFINHQRELQPFSTNTKGIADSLSIPLQKSILNIFQKLGPNKIFGFEIRPDSTFIVFIQNEYVKEFHLDIRERLSWSSNKINLDQDEFTKEKYASANWRYLIWYDKRGGW